jgi:hypothetical protein
MRAEKVEGVTNEYAVGVILAVLRTEKSLAALAVIVSDALTFGENWRGK